MNLWKISRTPAVLIAAMSLWGCQPPDMASIAAKQKARPAQLDNLEMFVGRWSAEFEATMMGSDEVMKGSGTSEVAWGVGGRFLVEKTTMEMGPEMGSMTGTSYWTWDGASRKYRSWWFDNWGMTGTGTSTYNAKKKQWRMTTSGRNMVDGQKTMMKGTVTQVDHDTLKWTFAEYDALGMIKFMEMTGTNRRQ